MLQVLQAKGLGLISDLGRTGYQNQGVPVCSVMDTYSYSLANVFLGNESNAACLELMGKFEFVCNQPVQLVLATRMGQATLNDNAVASGQVLSLKQGDKLQVLSPKRGVWSLLCVKGGFDVPPVLNSRSTCLQSGFGGFLGRGIREGDTLKIHAVTPSKHHRKLALPLASWSLNETVRVACLLGPEFQLLKKKEQKQFFEQTWSLSLNSSRMGFRFEGKALKNADIRSVKSHVVLPGIIQLPPIGKPIVLMSDAQVTGGYPRIAAVVEAELWKLVQLSPGDKIQFEPVTLEQAHQMNRLQQAEFGRLKQALLG